MLDEGSMSCFVRKKSKFKIVESNQKSLEEWDYLRST